MPEAVRTELTEAAGEVSPGAVTRGAVPLGHAAGSVLTARPVHPAPVRDEAGPQGDPRAQLCVHHLHWVDVPVLNLEVPHTSHEPVYKTL